MMMRRDSKALEEGGRVIIADDDEGCRRALYRLFQSAHFKPFLASTLKEALALLDEVSPVAVVSELRFPDGEGVTLLEAALSKDQYIGRIVLTGVLDYLAVQEVVNRASVHLFFTKPWDNSTLLQGVESVIERCRLALENAQLTSHLKRYAAQLEEMVRERTAQLEDIKGELQAIFDAFTEPQALVTKDLTVKRANRAWASFAGLDVREVPNRICYRTLFGRLSPCPQCPVVLSTGGEAILDFASMKVEVTEVPTKATLFLCRYLKLSKG